MEAADVLRRQLQRGAEVRVQGGPGGVQLRSAHLQAPQLRAVQLPGVAAQGTIAMEPHIFQEGVHRSVHFRLGTDVPI